MARKPKPNAMMAIASKRGDLLTKPKPIYVKPGDAVDMHVNIGVTKSGVAAFAVIFMPFKGVKTKAMKSGSVVDLSWLVGAAWCEQDR